jgi:hypothetical protein
MPAADSDLIDVQVANQNYPGQSQFVLRNCYIILTSFFKIYSLRKYFKGKKLEFRELPLFYKEHC